MFNGMITIILVKDATNYFKLYYVENHDEV